MAVRAHDRDDRRERVDRRRRRSTSMVDEGNTDAATLGERLGSAHRAVVQLDAARPVPRPSRCAGGDPRIVEVVAVHAPTARKDVREARNDAFRDHWGSLPSPSERWPQFVDGPFLRPDLSTLALIDGRVVAFCLASVNEEDWVALGALEHLHRPDRRRARSARPAAGAARDLADARGGTGCGTRAGRARRRHREQDRGEHALRASRLPRDAPPAGAGRATLTRSRYQNGRFVALSPERTRGASLGPPSCAWECRGTWGFPRIRERTWQVPTRRWRHPA